MKKRSKKEIKWIDLRGDRKTQYAFNRIRSTHKKIEELKESARTVEAFGEIEKWKKELLDLCKNYKPRKEAKILLKGYPDLLEKFNSKPIPLSQAKNEQFVFRKAGRDWEMIFDGESLGLLKNTVGCQYLYCLINNDTKDFTAGELEELLNSDKKPCVPVHKTPIDFEPEDEGSDEDKSQGIRIYKPGLIMGRQEIADPGIKETLKKLLKDKLELEGELERAKEENNTIEVVQFEKQIAEKSKILNQYEYKGILKTFADEGSKISKRIGKAIARAIEEIKRTNPKAGKHFQKAINPYSSMKRYNPPQKPNWVLE